MPEPMPRIRPDVESVIVDDERVVYDPPRHCVYVLNPTAVAVWDRCDGVRDFAAVVTELATAHGLANGQVEADVRACLADFASRDLLDAP
jgi:hypothetical protein